MSAAKRWSWWLLCCKTFSFFFGINFISISFKNSLEKFPYLKFFQPHYAKLFCQRSSEAHQLKKIKVILTKNTKNIYELTINVNFPPVDFDISHWPSFLIMDQKTASHSNSVTKYEHPSNPSFTKIDPSWQVACSRFKMTIKFILQLSFHIYDIPSLQLFPNWHFLSWFLSKLRHSNVIVTI